MKEIFKSIFNDKAIVFAFFANAIFIIAAIVFILFFYKSLPPFIPIFNQLPWGEKRLGETITIFIPILVATSILFINLLTSALTYKKTPLFARILIAVSLLTGILSFLFVAKTIILML